MTDKLKAAASMALKAMCSFKTATGGRISVHQLDGYDVFGTEIETLRKALAESCEIEAAVLAEREACLAIAEAYKDEWEKGNSHSAIALLNVVDQIKARGE